MIAAQDKAEIRHRLSVVCPTPTQWTPDQKIAVADAIDAVPPDNRAGMDLLAQEWDRLDKGSRICRSK